MPHWAETYVGLPYQPGKFDCADLVVKVQREIFRREIVLPSDHADSTRGRARQILACRDQFAVPTPRPEEGDAVLMINRGRAQHLGVLCVINGQRWVLHNVQGANGSDAGIGVCLHSVPMLAAFGYSIEEYYRWI